MIQEIPVVPATTIGIDFRANALTVAATCPPGPAIAGERLAAVAQGTIDIGTRGRLLGIELEDSDGEPLLAVSIDEATPADSCVLRTARIGLSVQVEATASDGGSIAIRVPRHGDGYDLSWPSGNQCWRRSAVGQEGVPAVTCAVVTSS